MHKEIIKKEVEKRNIKFLVHFTKLKNLPFILQNGLLTRDLVLNNYSKISVNDEYRMDRTNGICTSISFPNYKMFYSCRLRFPEEKWMVIGIKPDILWQKQCVFNFTNAASNLCNSIPLIEKTTSSSFMEMFGENYNNRQELKIPEHYTTDPQAEVIFLENIEKNHLIGFAVDNQNLYKKLTSYFPNENFKLKSELFSWRRDFSHWKKEE